MEFAIIKKYKELARDRKEDIAAATVSARQWLLINVAAMTGCSTSTVRRYVTMEMHRKIIKGKGNGYVCTNVETE